MIDHDGYPSYARMYEAQQEAEAKLAQQREEPRTIRVEIECPEGSIALLVSRIETLETYMQSKGIMQPIEDGTKLTVSKDEYHRVCPNLTEQWELCIATGWVTY